MDVINTAYQTTQEAKHACIDAITKSIVSHKDGPILFLYSGGSNKEVTSQIIMNLVQQQIQLDCFIAAVDERFDVEHSNYLELQKCVLQLEETIKSHGIHILDTAPFLRDQFAMADWYDNILKEKIQTIKNKQGIIITLLGMGEDGHIAGILPHPEEQQLFFERFLDTERFVVGYDATGKHEYTKRFTITYKPLLSSDYIYLFAAGKKKLSVFHEAMQQQVSLYERPVTFLFSLHSHFEVFLSRD